MLLAYALLLFWLRGVGFAGGESGAVDTRLLPGAITDDLAIGDQADRVGMGVLDRDEPDDVYLPLFEPAKGA